MRARRSPKPAARVRSRRPAPSARGLRSVLTVAAVFAVLVCVGALAMSLGRGSAGSNGLLPPVPEQLASRELHRDPSPSPGLGTHDPSGSEEAELAPQAPGAASLAGPPAAVVRRFAHDWANRDTRLTPATRREMVGLSAGAWAGAVFRQARLTLPAIEGAHAEGSLVMMKLETAGPNSKTALVVTQERLRDAEGTLVPPRYALYLARLDRVDRRGYAITAWEPQQ